MEIGVNRLEVERNTLTDNIVRLYYIIHAIYRKQTTYVYTTFMHVSIR